MRNEFDTLPPSHVREQRSIMPGLTGDSQDLLCPTKYLQVITALRRLTTALSAVSADLRLLVTKLHVHRTNTHPQGTVANTLKQPCDSLITLNMGTSESSKSHFGTDSHERGPKTQLISESLEGEDSVGESEFKTTAPTTPLSELGAPSAPFSSRINLYRLHCSVCSEELWADAWN